jgi:hypothetical protein
MIEVQDNRGGRLRIARNELVDKRPGEPVEISAGHLMFEPGEGRGTRQVLDGIEREAFHAHLKQGIVPETVRIIAVGIAGGDLIDPLGQEVPERMVNIGWMACVVHRSGQALCQADLAVDPSQQEGAKVGRQRPTVELGPDSVSRHGRKTELFWRRIRHKQTSWGFYGIGADHTLFYQRLTRGLCFFMNNPG